MTDSTTQATTTLVIPSTKLDLGCGDNKREGFFGIDKYKTNSTDAELDLLSFPWPIADESITEIHCSHFFEHIPKNLRPKFMDEVYRILKKGGTALFICPMGNRMYQDYTHEWPPVLPESFLYFDKDWRTANKLLHGEYDIKSDFSFTYGYSLDQMVASRNLEFQQFALKFFQNAATDLYVTLVKK